MKCNPVEGEPVDLEMMSRFRPVRFLKRLQWSPKAKHAVEWTERASGPWVMVAAHFPMRDRAFERMAACLKQWQQQEAAHLLVLCEGEAPTDGQVQALPADAVLECPEGGGEVKLLAQALVRNASASARLIAFSLNSAATCEVFHAAGIPTTCYLDEWTRRARPETIRSVLHGAQRIVFSGVEMLEDFRTEARKQKDRPATLPALQVVAPGLLPSFAGLESRPPSETFKIVGVPGTDRARSETLFAAAKAATDGQAECHWVFAENENFKAEICDADAAVICTTEDAYAQEALAALSIGKPILLFNATNGVEDFVKRYGGGHVFHLGDVEAVAEVLTEWMESPRLARTLGQAGREAFEEVGDWGRFADRIWQRIHNDFVGRHAFKSHTDVAAILKNSAVRRGMPRQSTPAPDRRLIALSEKDHQRMRALLQPFFTPKFVQAFSPEIEKCSRELVTKFPEDPRDVDWWNDYILPFTQTILMQFVGLPDHLKMPLFHLFDSKVFAYPPEDIDVDHRAMMAEMHEGFLDLVMPHIEGAPAGLETATNVVEMLQLAFRDGTIEADEVCDLAEAIIRGGSGTSAHHMRQALTFLAARPEKWQEIREHPAMRAQAIEELLRLNSTAAANEWMVAEADFVVGHQQVQEGDRIHIQFAQANLDPTFFSSPETLDIHRKNATKHLAFSHGIHHCLGAWLMRAEMTAALTHLTERYPEFTMKDVAVLDPKMNAS